MSDTSDYQREAREKRRALVEQFMELQGSCDDCGETDARVLSYFDDDYKSVNHLANQKVAPKRLMTVLANAHLLCPTDHAKRLADLLEDKKRQIREHKEMEAEVQASVMAETGHSFDKSLAQLRAEGGES